MMLGADKFRKVIKDLIEKIFAWINKKLVETLEELLGVGLSTETSAKLEGMGLRLKPGATIINNGITQGKQIAVYHKGIKVFEAPLTY